MSKRVWFSLYCGAVLWLLFVQGRSQPPPQSWEMLAERVNLIPFRTIRGCLFLLRRSTDPHLRSYALGNLWGNLVLFLPWGLLLPELFPRFRGFGRFFLCSGGWVLLAETVQLLTGRGRWDVDDLLLNLAGMALGYLINRAGSPPSAAPPDGSAASQCP